MQQLHDTSESSEKTRTVEILQAIRADIIETRLAPDTKLRFDELREMYKIGISPLREALMHLAAEGLVVAEHRKGYRVAPFSESDLKEIARLRGEFDSLAIRESIQKGDELWEGRIVAAYHTLSKHNKIIEEGKIDPEWEQYHTKFHSELTSACGMPKLLAFSRILDMQARRYRKIAVHYMTAPRCDLDEHREIRDAVLAHNADLAEQLIKQHYMTTVEIILSKKIT